MTRNPASSRSPCASSRRTRGSAASASTAATAGGGSGSAPRSTPVSSRERQNTHPAYRREVHLEARIPVEDWTAVLTGRLDGCLEREPGHWLIEELKSTNLSVDGVRPQGYAFERDRRQLLGYCYLWKRLGHGRVGGALVYVDIETGEELSLQVPFDEDVERDVERRLARFLGIWRGQKIARQRKAKAAERLPFPHTAPRPGQETMIEAVRTAVRNREHLLAEAPTGSGKTAAALHPALAEGLATRPAGRLPHLEDAPAEDGRLRPRRHERARVPHRAGPRQGPHVRQRPDHLPRGLLPVRQRLSREDGALEPARDGCATPTRTTIRTSSSRRRRREEVCPFEVQLELAHRADAIVADYNYVFEPAAALRHLTGEDLREVILLVDEAHNLPDRARQIFSPEILEEELAALRNRLVLQPGELFQDIVASVEELGRHPRRVRGRPSRGRSDRGDRSAAGGRPRAPGGVGAEAHALPRVEAGDAPGARRRPRPRLPLHAAALRRGALDARPRLLRGRRAPRLRHPARARLPRPGAGALLDLPRGLLGRASLGDPDPARSDPARARPGGRPHLLDLPATALPSREPQGDDRALGPDDLHRAGAQLRPHRRASRRDVRRPRRQRPRALSVVPVSRRGRLPHAGRRARGFSSSGRT